MNYRKLDSLSNGVIFVKFDLEVKNSITLKIFVAFFNADIIVTIHSSEKTNFFL
jgi:hypothetical protein